MITDIRFLGAYIFIYNTDKNISRRLYNLPCNDVKIVFNRFLIAIRGNENDVEMKETKMKCVCFCSHTDTSGTFFIVNPRL